MEIVILLVASGMLPIGMILFAGARTMRVQARRDLAKIRRLTIMNNRYRRRGR